VHEALLDDSVQFAESLRAAGVEVQLDIFPEMLHSFQMMAGFAPEADDAIGRFGKWIRPRLARVVPGRPQDQKEAALVVPSLMRLDRAAANAVPNHAKSALAARSRRVGF